jgi:hypothetical protein
MESTDADKVAEMVMKTRNRRSDFMLQFIEDRRAKTLKFGCPIVKETLNGANHSLDESKAKTTPRLLLADLTKTHYIFS